MSRVYHFSGPVNTWVDKMSGECDIHLQSQADKMSRLDAKRLLDRFRNAGELRRAFEALGMEPPEAGTVRQWRLRGQISAAWLPRVLSVLEADTGQPVTISDYMEDSECPVSPSKAKSKPTGELPGIYD